ncbi:MULTISPECIES: TolC family protein [Ramlibacter]|uniref:TolC family protein n=1 Tax=Ramlibacter pinisoli TaxID=2682844 RepID=A0A6N8IZI3_9BURK|nr:MULTISPECIES: TolC family protein [Ramlibacter]MBA2962029.1 TolC family protein [Ramlibacter sp. CGMCC 1.13660]MVQ31972.1 TolC family protein [Ramlibacter pinisoli]
MLIRFLPAAAVVAAWLPALAPAAPLSLEQALELAAQRSQSVRAARAGASGAAEAARAAGQLPDPMLIVGIENLPVTGPDRLRTNADSMTMKRLGVTQEWVSSDKRALRQAAATAQVGREAAIGQVALADTRLQTALAYLDAYYAAEALKLTTLTEHHVHEEAEAARARLASSTGSSQEVLQLTAARGVAEDESADVGQAQASALATLQRWVGLAADDLAAPALPATTAEQAWVASHPAVVQAQRDIEVARAEASATAVNRQPNWTWEASYGQRTGFSDMVNIGVTIPLPVAPGERQDRATAARLALVGKAEAALEEATRTASGEYRSLASDARRLAQRLERYRAGVVTPTQQRTQAALAGYRSNQVPLMTLFEARHAEVDVQRKLLTLQRDLARVQAQLAFKSIPGGAP